MERKNEKLREKRKAKLDGQRTCRKESNFKDIVCFTRTAKRDAAAGICQNKMYQNKGGHKTGDICNCFKTCNVCAISEQEMAPRRRKKKEYKQ